MDTGSILVLSILGGGFIIGVWFILIRRDAALEVRQGMVADGLRAPVQGSSFSSARSEFERKLIMIESERRRRNLSGGSISLIQQEQQPIEPVQEEEPPVEVEEVVEEEDNEESEEDMLERRRLRDEEWARREEEEERRRLEEEEAALAEQQERLKKEQEEQAEKDRLEAEKAAEEARLAAERDAAAQAERDAEEATRQAELAAAEEQRLAEIRAAQEKEALERRKAASRALEELRARLEREGARSSDVQVSLMWNNYNDLDLHVVCPSGERIHGGNRKSACGGELDVDANVRPDSRKPVENVVWPEGEAPAGTYQVFAHYYKKHKKRRSKDPTKFQVIANAYGDLMEYSGELSFGEEIQLVCTFEVPTMEERERIKRDLEEQIRRSESGEISADQILADEATPKQVEFGELVDEIESEIADQPEDDGSGVPPAPDLD
ncbi:MAG: hypothetical protein CMA41_03170 [Euryarchaeota archaeon]|nr:hypothetical protein [Euryarchaeota archaeon]CAI8362606.1 MAG: Uncharacterised protein [Euryarchaeota archaeon UBA443]|tara:strand:+ start:8575 stop:9888 length:1314 start_codon:yes stop_codon:yes gene_type:complete